MFQLKQYSSEVESPKIKQQLTAHILLFVLKHTQHWKIEGKKCGKEYIDKKKPFLTSGVKGLPSH
jgi:hypothetical protein